MDKFKKGGCHETTQEERYPCVGICYGCRSFGTSGLELLADYSNGSKPWSFILGNLLEDEDNMKITLLVLLVIVLAGCVAPTATVSTAASVVNLSTATPTATATVSTPTAIPSTEAPTKVSASGKVESNCLPTGYFWLPYNRIDFPDEFFILEIGNEKVVVEVSDEEGRVYVIEGAEVLYWKNNTELYGIDVAVEGNVSVFMRGVPGKSETMGYPIVLCEGKIYTSIPIKGTLPAP